MEIKGFILKPKKGSNVNMIRSKLEEIVGTKHMSLVTVRKHEEYTVMMQNANGLAEVYTININTSKEGEIATLICEPWYDKLINPDTQKPIIPKVLAPYLKKIKECKIEAKLYGAQG